MRISLHYKLFAAILSAVLFVTLYMTFVFQWSFDKGFLEYVNTVEREQLQKIAEDLEKTYKKRKSWNWIVENPTEIAITIVNSYPEGDQKERFIKRLREKKTGSRLLNAGPLPAEIPVHFFRRVFLLDEKKMTLFGHDVGESTPYMTQIYHQNRIVGYLGAHPAKHLSNSHHLVFVKQQKLALILVAAAGLCIAAGLSFPIAYRLTKPIRKMAEATRNLASGEYTTRIASNSSDELGRLAVDLNDLAIILEKNRIARSQWIADISHELRTPLSILRGKIEALQDGVYTPSAEHFKELHREIMHLGLLVDDLYQLSLSDVGAMTYNKLEIEPCWALEQAIELMADKFSDKQQRLEKAIHLDHDITIMGDNERLKQLFTNLLSNSNQYTNSGGIIRIDVQNDREFIIYTIEDSAPGVSEDHLEKLFNRLYRVERSRSRSSGGAGLGLSICANIVNGHHGFITALPAELGGVSITVKLPLHRK